MVYFLVQTPEVSYLIEQGHQYTISLTHFRMACVVPVLSLRSHRKLALKETEVLESGVDDRNGGGYPAFSLVGKLSLGGLTCLALRKPHELMLKLEY